MSVQSDGEDVVVEADGAELAAPRGEAVAAVLEEGQRVEREWTAEDYADDDWDHPDTRPRMRGWLHLFAFFGSLVTGAVLVPLAASQGARAGWSVAVYCRAEALVPVDGRTNAVDWVSQPRCEAASPPGPARSSPR